MARVFGSPIARSAMGCRVNKTLHGRSVHRPEDVPGHNVIIGYSRPGTGDALDLFGVAGTPVRAMYEGMVERIAQPDGRLGLIQVASRSDKVRIAYAHLSVGRRWGVGDIITRGEPLGVIGDFVKDPHLHLEVWIDGRPISDPDIMCLACKIARLTLGYQGGR